MGAKSRTAREHARKDETRRKGMRWVMGESSYLRKILESNRERNAGARFNPISPHVKSPEIEKSGGALQKNFKV
jgi:hypothetical protein